MNGLVYARYELLRTVRNRRFYIVTFALPLVLYYAIAGPSRHVTDLQGTGISAPLYYMVSLATFGAMNGALAGGARIAAERATGWNRQLRLTAAHDAQLLPGQGRDDVSHRPDDDPAALRRGGDARRLARRRHVARDDAAAPDRPRAVRGARHPRRPSVHARLDRPGDRRDDRGSRPARRRLVPDLLERVPARPGGRAAVLLARAGGAHRDRRESVGRRWAGRSSSAGA